MSFLQQHLAQLCANRGKSSLFPDSQGGGWEVSILSLRDAGGCLLMCQARHTCVEEQ